jgi:hypothetical protein
MEHNVAEEIIEIVGTLSDAIGKGQEVLAFFQGGDPTMESIAEAFAAEVKQIFNNALAAEDARQVAADLESTRQFFAGDYVNAKKAGESMADLQKRLQGSDGPHLDKMRSNADLMAGWVSNPSLVDGGQATVDQSAALYLSIMLFICLTHRELSANAWDTNAQAPDRAVSDSELLDMETTAQTALTTM